jgi:hypothetical protein
MMLEINAPLKLVIAGNHDFSVDTPVFQEKMPDNTTSLFADLVRDTYGNIGEARALFETDAAKAAGSVFLDEGNHSCKLDNGASLSVYASPYTASKSCTWGFQYHPAQEHIWNTKSNTDVVITHSPPKGVLGYTDAKPRAGSASLFAAVARARPNVHCFRHIHEAWGAKAVVWRKTTSDEPSHFVDIDNDLSIAVESLRSLYPGKFDTPEIVTEKIARREMYDRRRYIFRLWSSEHIS